jgi:hypothetical protein
MTLNTRRKLRAAEARRYKQAWLLATGWVGRQPTVHERTVPAYANWRPHELEEHLAHLRSDYRDVLGRIFTNGELAERRGVAKWMSDQFEAWQRSGGGLYSVSTAGELEERFGALRARDAVEVPPYADLLMQGWYGLAIRHPEYHLARDLEFLCRLFRDAEAIIRRADIRRDLGRGEPTTGALGGVSENAQTLGRAVVMSCFNLIESFISGLARGAVLEDKTIAAEQAKKLLDNAKPLRWRVFNVPLLITGRQPPIQDNTEPMATLFGRLKTQRDAFVHCEPGPQPSSRGHVKEKLFHDITPAVVNASVRYTSDLVRLLWHHVHGRSGPHWMPDMSMPQLTSGDLCLTESVAEPNAS